MSKDNVMIFEAMRPPVAAEKGNTPLRGKGVKDIFSLGTGHYQNKNGTPITKNEVVLNYTDDARMEDSVWDRRHQVSPSAFNTKNSIFNK